MNIDGYVNVIGLDEPKKVEWISRGCIVSLGIGFADDEAAMKKYYDSYITGASYEEFEKEAKESGFIDISWYKDDVQEYAKKEFSKFDAVDLGYSTINMTQSSNPKYPDLTILFPFQCPELPCEVDEDFLINISTSEDLKLLADEYFSDAPAKSGCVYVEAFDYDEAECVSYTGCPGEEHLYHEWNSSAFLYLSADAFDGKKVSEEVENAFFGEDAEYDDIYYFLEEDGGIPPEFLSDSAIEKIKKLLCEKEISSEDSTVTVELDGHKFTIEYEFDVEEFNNPLAYAACFENSDSPVCDYTKEELINEVLLGEDEGSICVDNMADFKLRKNMGSFDY